MALAMHRRQRSLWLATMRDEPGHSASTTKAIAMPTPCSTLSVSVHPLIPCLLCPLTGCAF